MTSAADQPPPSTAAIAVATAILSGLTGYFLGQAKSIGLFGSPVTKTKQPSPAAKTRGEDSDISDAAESGDDDDDDQPELSGFNGNTEECKLVLVVRTDLGMTKGKIAAQCSHATLACYKTFLRTAPDSPILKRWERLGQAKIAVQVKSEEEMLTLQAQALSVGLCAQVIHDAGRTQIASGSATVLGVGPGPKSMIDQITGHLKLL